MLKFNMKNKGPSQCTITQKLSKIQTASFNPNCSTQRSETSI